MRFVAGVEVPEGLPVEAYCQIDQLNPNAKDVDIQVRLILARCRQARVRINYQFYFIWLEDE